jgi:shikimate dehydrogenase
MKTFGLLGYPLTHSFSKEYFTKKFSQMQLDEHQYLNFEIDDMDKLFPEVIEKHSTLKGFNVTIPYKQKIISYLDDIDQSAREIGAVNTVKALRNNKSTTPYLKGFNTDVYGFEVSLKEKLKNFHSHALVLGTGGASKAVEWVLRNNNINYLLVSRNPSGEQQISYDELKDDIILSHKLIINTTPLGTYPNITNKPDISYNLLSSQHYLYDLVYNPSLTEFLREGKKHGCFIMNGLKMLHLQAEKAWEIWNS